jgi:hypothetical protein
MWIQTTLRDIVFEESNEELKEIKQQEIDPIDKFIKGTERKEKKEQYVTERVSAKKHLTNCFLKV